MRNHLIILLFCVPLVSWAQSNVYNPGNKRPQVRNYQEVDERPMHFGFTIGFNTMDFHFKNDLSHIISDSLTADVTVLKPGFHVNIITDYRLGNNLSARFLPGLNFGQRNITYWKSDGSYDADMLIESNLLDFPVLLKYKAKRINNYRPFVIAGGNVRLDMAAKRKYDENEEVYVRIKKLDYYYEFGFGIDFYSMYFKFSTEFKYSVGLRNILTNQPEERHPQYVNVIDRLNSNLFLVSFHFE